MVNTIRNLVKLEMGLVALIITTQFFTDAYLPVELQEYIALEAESPSTTLGFVVLIVLLVVALVNIVSLFGLLGIKAWARNAYIYSTILMFPLCVFIGPQVEHAVGYTLDQLSVLIQGMILSLLVYNNSYQEVALNKTIQPTTNALAD